MRSLAAWGLAVLLLCTFEPALASESCQTTTSHADAQFGSGNPGTMTIYVVVDGMYVYRESNMMPGLQRSDDRRDDTCGGVYSSDIWVL